jgi:hypothetical protein
MTLEECRRFFADEIRFTANIGSPELIDAFARVQREEFLGPGPWEIASADMRGLSASGAMQMSYTPVDDPRHLYHNVMVVLDKAGDINNGQPSALARWIDALDLKAGDRAYHLGCGVGYHYATLFYAEYDPQSRQLSYVNAGHNPPAVLRKSTATCQVLRLETGGPVIGILPQCYQQGSFVVEPGDQVVLFTDGVSESMDPREEEWGEENLIEFAKTCHGLPAFDAMTRIMAAAEAFAAGASQHDDMTLVVLCVLP